MLFFLASGAPVLFQDLFYCRDVSFVCVPSLCMRFLKRSSSSSPLPAFLSLSLAPRQPGGACCTSQQLQERITAVMETAVETYSACPEVSYSSRECRTLRPSGKVPYFSRRHRAARKEAQTAGHSRCLPERRRASRGVSQVPS